ncbi:MAG: GAF domain-containing sensor histidine kinase [Actinomycetota bacterium]|nr:GAF domain-containing sensor histidine kinase [Actinomycetota bacterium]
MPESAWSTQQLAEFLAAVSSCESAASAALAAVERAAEALDAEVAAILSGGEIVAVVGYPEGAAPVTELRSVTPGDAGAKLPVPGVGVCPATGVSLQHPPDATLVLARSGSEGLSPEEAGLLRGMARVTSMTLRMLRLLDAERGARTESDRQAAENARLLATLTKREAEQAALRRIATLVARGLPPEDVFAAVTEEVARLVGADATVMVRKEADEDATVAASWSAEGSKPPLRQPGRVSDPEGGLGLPGEGSKARWVGNLETAGGTIFVRARPARFELPHADGPEPDAAVPGPGAVRCVIGCPIIVEGCVWGAIFASSTRPDAFPEDTESRIMDFTELVATAISNAASRAQLAASRARIVATADETRRRIERDLHDGIQQRLVALALDLQGVRDALPMEREELLAELSDVGEGLRGVLEELREISRGVHPAILSEGGLAPALKSLARRSAVPVELDLGTVGRLPEPVEVAAYYVVSEALANAAKHARASVVRVDLGLRDGALRLSIRDDGVGGADTAGGAGILGLVDRVEALGGTMAVTSPPGQGTAIVVELPAELR